ncbi:MAG TPA: S8 family serine peptidase [Dehalococcoidia bacterium]|nr:S8 family serine peptidase [Dehalococcoidia bacterium]
MLRVLPISSLALVAALLLLRPAAQPAPRPAPDLDAPAAAGEVLVHLTPHAAALTDEMLESRLGLKVRERIADLGVLRAELTRGEGMAEAIARVSALPWVSFAEPNHLVRATYVPNDILFSGQTGYLDRIEASSAWDIERGHDAVVVAVLDSGIDFEHEDLREGLWQNLFEVPANGVDDDRNGCVDDVNGCSFVTPDEAGPGCNMQANAGIRDDNGHGTFVAGIIGARADNVTGISGVAPGVSLMAVKILDCLGGGTAADAAQGLLYAARMGARVSNLSFGADGESVTLGNAIREATNRYGMVIVTATGNEGHARVSFPARLPETIAVASSGAPGDPNARSPFSDWGPEVTVAAPGLNIISTVPPNFCNVTWLCVQDGPYALASGTSFAAPLVSGLAALLISHTANLSPSAVKALIASTAEPLPDAGTPNWDGAGRIRMRRALSVPRFYLGAPGIAKQ